MNTNKTFNETPIVISKEARSEIVSALGHPILDVSEDLMITDEMIDNLFIAPALRYYFTYWPRKLKQEFKIVGQYDIPFPNEHTFGITMARVATVSSAQGYGKSPFLNEVIKQQTTSYRSYGLTPYGRNPYITQGIAIKEQVEQQSYITLRKAGTYNIDNENGRLWGFSSVQGNLIIDWAMWSKNFDDVKFEHINDAIQICQMFALRYVGRLRSQSDPNTGVTADGSTFLEEANKIEDDILKEKWKGRSPVAVLS